MTVARRVVFSATCEGPCGRTFEEVTFQTGWADMPMNLSEFARWLRKRGWQITSRRGLSHQNQKASPMDVCPDCAKKAEE